MKLRLAVILICGALITSAVVASAQAEAGGRPDYFCNKARHFCIGVQTIHATKLWIGTLRLRGRYGLCVRTPKLRTTCRHFRLQPRSYGPLYKDAVLFAKHFPHRQAGRYTATWHKSGDRLGPPVPFHVR